jgi:hypothetical protein
MAGQGKRGVGASVGDTVGTSEGMFVGRAVGDTDGTVEGAEVWFFEGVWVGIAVGSLLGLLVGINVGEPVKLSNLTVALTLASANLICGASLVAKYTISVLSSNCVYKSMAIETLNVKVRMPSCVSRTVNESEFVTRELSVAVFPFRDARSRAVPGNWRVRKSTVQLKIPSRGKKSDMLSSDTISVTVVVDDVSVAVLVVKVEAVVRVAVVAVNEVAVSDVTVVVAVWVVPETVLWVEEVVEVTVVCVRSSALPVALDIRKPHSGV